MVRHTMARNRVVSHKVVEGKVTKANRAGHITGAPLALVDGRHSQDKHGLLLPICPPRSTKKLCELFLA